MASRSFQTPCWLGIRSELGQSSDGIGGPAGSEVAHLAADSNGSRCSGSPAFSGFDSSPSLVLENHLWLAMASYRKGLHKSLRTSCGLYSITMASPPAKRAEGSFHPLDRLHGLFARGFTRTFEFPKDTIFDVPHCFPPLCRSPPFPVLRVQCYEPSRRTQSAP